MFNWKNGHINELKDEMYVGTLVEFELEPGKRDRILRFKIKQKYPEELRLTILRFWEKSQQLIKEKSSAKKIKIKDLNA